MTGGTSRLVTLAAFLRLCLPVYGGPDVGSREARRSLSRSSNPHLGPPPSFGSEVGGRSNLLENDMGKSAVPAEEPVVMEEDFYGLVADLLASRCAVATLAELLQTQRAGGAVLPPMLGAGVLLEGVAMRLEASLDMAVGMGHALGFAQALEHAGYPAVL